MALLEAVGLEKTYYDGDTETPALCGVTFNVKSGEFVAIMGPSGSGKSTLLHILGFLDRHTAGTYRFDGKTIDDYSKEEIAHVRNRKMGFVFQTFNLLRRTTVLENVKLPLLYSGIKESEWNDMATAAIESVGLSHRLHYDSSRLSGGEKQRVAIARALVLGPEVIFADEPTGNLDSKSGQAIMTILQKLNIEEKHTIILITHESYTAEHAERIIHVKDGKIEEDHPVLERRTSDHFTK
jgi:putative ABC transport system ATP-binding protein